MNVINFGQAKICAIAWESEDDFFEFLKKCDTLFNNAGDYPLFYVIRDQEAKDEDVAKITRFIHEMNRIKADLATIKRNLDAGRFPDITGTREKQWWEQ